MQEQNSQAKLNSKQSFMLYLHDLTYILSFVILVFIFCFRLVIVSGASMYDTLVDGDYLLLVSNTFYHNPAPGDIIVAGKDSFRNGEAIVKRVIATEGQTVDIDFSTGEVFVDGVKLEEDYVYSPTVYEGIPFPLTVEAGHIFVMGDNRSVSMDSRNPEIGLIDKREVLGKVILLFFPGNDGGREVRQFSRIGLVRS